MQGNSGIDKRLGRCTRVLITAMLCSQVEFKTRAILEGQAIFICDMFCGMYAVHQSVAQKGMGIWSLARS